MKIRRFVRSWKWLLLVAACGCNPGPEAAKGRESVTVFVAASTKDAVQEIASAFQKDKNVEVKINADDSAKLATQIAQDAPAHLFLSANEKWADFVKEKGFALETKLLLGNTLVLVTPKGNPVKIRTPADLAKPSLKRLALAGPTVPAGIYARQALTKLKLLESLEADKKVVAGDNVRVALTYVERGEVDAGIVYATDAKISNQVERVCTFPAETHDPIHYPLVLLKAANTSASARSLYEFLQSQKAKDLFAAHGFSLLEKK